jgi:N-acetylglucosaminyldiphosphoundecaprenol N-acetyl-beta-D-mannosaminyltransferase
VDLGGVEGPRPNVLGVSIDALTMTQAVSRCTEAIDSGTYVSIGVVNAAKIVAMRQDIALRRAVTECTVVLADGQSIVWASHVLGRPLPERVAGIDLFQALLAEAERRGDSVYFLGARREILDRMLDQVRILYPALIVAGARDGYFSSSDEPDVVRVIRESGADLLFLGMSSPKKEVFLWKWGESTGVKVSHGVGGSFDVLAGLTRRAPAWYQEHGLEWFYRAKQEPRRLGRRYLTTNTAFMLLLARDAVKTRLGRQTRPVQTISPAAAGAADPPTPAVDVTASRLTAVARRDTP